MMDDGDLVAQIIASEGTTYTNDPLDAGGPTKFGITLRELSAARGRTLTAADVEALEQPEAERIYRTRWIAPFAALPDGLRQNVVDMGVNAGRVRAVKLLQQMVGAAVDGALGPQTLRLVGGERAAEHYAIMRLAFYESLIERKPSQAKWRRGWRARASQWLPGTPMVGTIRGLLAAWHTERTGKAYLE